MVHFVGAGPGAPDLITRRGAALLQEADCIIYAGSLVNPALLGLAKPECAVYNSAEMTLEQVLDVMRRVEAAGGTTVRLHTGDPCLYGAIPLLSVTRRKHQNRLWNRQCRHARCGAEYPCRGQSRQTHSTNIVSETLCWKISSDYCSRPSPMGKMKM